MVKSTSLDDVVALYLQTLRDGQPCEPESFVARWPQHRSEFLTFVSQNSNLQDVVTEKSRIPGANDQLTHCESIFADEYRLGPVIGQGGMGTVIEAIRITDEHRCAIKVLNLQVSSESSDRQRFYREARAIESVEHPHIVPLYDFGEREGQPFLVMKLIDGVTLADVIAERSRTADLSGSMTQECDALSFDRIDGTISRTAFCLQRALGEDDYFTGIARLVANVAGALEVAHQSKIVHRDIKPANLLLDTFGKVWLTDFGLASIDECQTVLTTKGDILGTPAFMSPEQARGAGNPLDHRADIYALGATLYALTALRKPFSGSTRHVLRNVSDGLLAAPSRFRSDIPKALEAIILKAMARTPSRRYQSAAVFEHDLRQFVAGRAVTAKLPGFPERLLQLAAANPRITLTSSMLLLAVVASVIVIQLVVSQRMSGVNFRLQNANEQLAVSNQQLARTNTELTESEHRIRHHLYVADVSAAYRAYERRDIDVVGQLLARHVPAAGEPDFRCFAWWLLHEMTQPEKVRDFIAHSGAAEEVAVIPGTQETMTVGADGRLRRWSPQSTQAVGDYLIGGTLNAIGISPDGASFVVGSNVPIGMNPVTLRDGKTGAVIAELTEHAYSVESAVFSADGKYIATAGRYHDVLVHDAAGKLLHRLTTGSRNESVAFSPDSSFLFTIIRPNTGGRPHQFVQAWRLPMCQPAFALETDFDISTFAVSETSDRMIVASGDHLTLFNWVKKKPIARRYDLRGRIRNVAISADGSRIAAGCDNGLLCIWDDTSKIAPQPSGKKFLKTPRTYDTGSHGITSVQFAADDGLVFTNRAGRLHVYQQDAPNPEVIDETRVVAVCQSQQHPEQTYLRSLDGTVRRYTHLASRSGQTPAEAPRTISSIPIDNFGRMALSPDEQCLAVDSPAKLVVINSISGATEAILTRSGPEKSCRDLLFSQDGKQLLLLLNDRIVVYKVGDWSEHRDVILPADNCVGLSIPPGQQEVVVTARSKLIRLQPDTYEVTREYSARASDFSTVGYSSSGRLVAAGQIDGTIDLLDRQAMRQVKILRGHHSNVMQCLFTNDDKTLVTCSFDETLRFWDVETGRELGGLKSEMGDLWHLLFAEKERTLITMGPNTPIQRWFGGPQN